MIEQMTSRNERTRRAGLSTLGLALVAVLLVLALASCNQAPKKAATTSTTSSAQQGAAQETKKAAPTITGTVEYVEGDVTLNGVATQIGATVRNGDTVKTGANGLCDITFAGRNIVQIQGGSLAVMNFGDIGRGIQLESGALAAVLKNLAATETANRFQVDTPTSVAGIRGTTFYVKVLSPDATYFCLCNGRVELQDSSGGNQMTLEASHHKAVEYVRKDGQVTVESKPMLYHTDAEMQSLASKIGYTIDWNKPDLVN